MKILIPIISFGKSGGIKVLSNLANYWTEAGHEVTFVSASNTVDPYYPLICKVIYINAKGEVRVGNERYNIFQKLLGLSKYINKVSLKFDAVIANYNLTAYPVSIFSKTKNFYYIQAYEPEFYDEIENNLLKKNAYKFIAWCSYFLPMVRVVNSNMYLNFKNIRASEVSFPGINLDIYFPRERIYKKNGDIFIIGCIGRTEEWKGSGDVAEAIKILNTRGYKNIEFHVAFNPVDYDNHILIMAYGDAELSNYYRSLDILITPGHIQLDAIHYPVIEAMATKTPLITTGYYPSSDKNSFIVPPQSPIEIADKVEYLMKNYDMAIEKANLAYTSIQQFSWESVSKNFLSIIKKNVN